MPKTKPDTPEEEIFIDRKKPDPWTAKPLTLEGTARLIQLVGGVMMDAAQRMAVEEVISPDGPPRPGWSILLGVLGTEQLAEFLSIVTGKSPQWVTKNYSLAGASRAIMEFGQKEDLAGVLKNLISTATTWAGAVGTDGSQELSTDSSASTAAP